MQPHNRIQLLAIQRLSFQNWICPYEHKLSLGSEERGGKSWRIVESPNGPVTDRRRSKPPILRTGRRHSERKSNSAVIFLFSPVRAELRDGEVDRAHGSRTRKSNSDSGFHLHRRVADKHFSGGGTKDHQEPCVKRNVIGCFAS